MPVSQPKAFESSAGAGRWVLTAAYAGAGVATLALAWLPLESSIHRFLYEDYFYYLQIARNIVLGLGVSVDGVAPTNGFHPLWMVVCVLAQALAGPMASIHVVLTLAALIHCAQAFLLFRIVSRMADVPAGHMAALFWIANYRVIACNLCGLETPIAVLGSLAVALHLQRARAPGAPRWAVELGVLLALAALARFDLLLLGVVVLAALVVVLDPALPRAARAADAGVAGGVALLLLLPWFVWSYRHSGTLLPNSGTALGIWGFKHVELGNSLATNLAILREQLFGLSFWFTDTANLLGLWPVVQPSSGKVGLFLFAALLSGSGALLFATRRDEGARLRWVLACFAWGLFAYYALFARLDVRYLMPFCAITVVLLVAQGSLFVRHRPAAKRLFLASYALLFLVSGIAGVQAYQQRQGAARTHSGHLSLLEMARWIGANVPADAVLGGWNTGIVSYFSGRTVVNLDGVVNDQAIPYLRRRDLASYMDQRHIDYLVDGEGQIDFFMSGFGGQPVWRSGYSLLKQIDSIQLMQRQER